MIRNLASYAKLYLKARVLERCIMNKISINRNGLGIFKLNAQKTSKPKEASAAGSSNPFGLNFKGNVIQADVFETSKKNTTNITSGLREKLANTGKVFKSTIVGGINSFNESLKQKAGGIVAFGRKAKESISKAIDFANNYDIGAEIKNTFSSVIESVTNSNQYSVRNLVKRPVSELELLFKDELKLIEA